MRQAVKAKILEALPKGITLRRDNSLWVSKYKEYHVNGEKKSKRMTETVKLDIDNTMSDAKQLEKFEEALGKAIKVKSQMKDRLANRSFLLTDNVKIKGEAYINNLYQDLVRLDTWKGKHGETVASYAKDILAFFKDRENFNPKLKDFHDVFTLADFKKWAIVHSAQKRMNNYNSCSTNTVNKRLGLLRQLTQFAIKQRLFSLDDCIDPSAKNYGIQDERRAESKPKPALSIAEEQTLLKTIQKYEDGYFYDVIVFALDTGVRHDGELNRITPEQIDFGKKHLVFKRPKTGKWSTIPLTERCMEILKRRREVAMKNEGNRFFPISKSSLRHNWDKYIRLSGLNDEYTPYSTRHTFITRLVEADVSPKAVQHLAGHKSIETTLQYYTHSTNEVLETAITKLEEYKKVKAKKAEVSPLIGHNSRKVLK